MEEPVTIGAYKVKLPKGEVVFLILLDMQYDYICVPWHVTDIVVLVVAADDGNAANKKL